MNKKREWVKNAAIIFLAVMLVLTFFSNTIMNYSLPEVSAQYVESGNLSEQIRGSGTVEANQTYEVKIDETRTIASVEVKEGDIVAKGQTLFKLEDSDSEELDAAEKNLRAAKKAYDEASLSAGFDYRADEIDIAAQEADLADLKKELGNISVYQEEYEKAKEKVDGIKEEIRGYEKEVKDIDREIKGYENEIKDLDDETKDYDDILAAVEAKDYEALGKDNYNKIKRAQDNLADAEKAKAATEEKIKEYENAIASGGNEESIAAARKAVEDKQLQISNIQRKINDIMVFGSTGETSGGGTQEGEGEGENTGNTPSAGSSDSTLADLQAELAQMEIDLKYLQEDYNREMSKSSNYSINKQQLEAQKTTLTINQQKVDSAQRALDNAIAAVRNDIKGKTDDIDEKVDAVNAKIDEANERKDDLNYKIEDANSRLTDAQTEEAEAKAKADVTTEDQEAKIRDAENNLEKSKIALSQKKEQDAITAGKNAIDLQDLLAAVDDAEAEVEKYRSKSTGAEIKAAVGGKIVSLSFSAGEKATMDSVLANIEMTEKGYALEFSVSSEQARKIKAGDEAEVQYYWGGDASAVLESIVPDKTNPSQRKTLRFSITGDVTPGQTLQIAMGSKGQRYDYIVPNSSIREDSNGKFVLVVTAKSSPLGNRYIAERVDVEVLASDDTRSAVSGGFLGGEFIISTSTKPIEPGMQVRLVE